MRKWLAITILHILNIIHFIPKKLHRRPHILLYCSSNTMLPHLTDYYDHLKSQNYQFYLYSKNRNLPTKLNSPIKIIHSKLMLILKSFDLFVSPDVDMPFYFQSTPSLYVNHGLNIVRANPNTNLFYTYGPNSISAFFKKPKFNIILEPNKTIAKTIPHDYPIFKNHVIHSGYKFAERITNGINSRQTFRKKLGIKNNQKLVCVFSSWGNNSLFHQIGSNLISQAEELINTKKYTFILSAHPKEYTNYSKQAIGNFIDSKAEKDFIVRKPSEDFLPFLIAADIVICDYSSMCELAILAKKPIILSSFNLKNISSYSDVYKYYHLFPVFHNGDSLIEKINQAEKINLTNISGKNSDIFISLVQYDELLKKITSSLLGDHYHA